MPHHPPPIRPTVEDLDARVVLNGTFTVHAMVIPSATHAVVSSVQFPSTAKVDALRAQSIDSSVAAIRSISPSSLLATSSRTTASVGVVSTSSGIASKASRVEIPKGNTSSTYSSKSVTLSHGAIRPPSSANLTSMVAPYRVVAPSSGLAFRNLSRISINGRIS